MPRDVDRVLRAGVRVAVIAAAVGLLMLALARVAWSDEIDLQGAAGGLLDPGTRTAAERTETAVRILEHERRARATRAAYELMQIGLRASIQASPRRMLGSARRLGKELWSWRDRSPAEDVALALIEPDVERGVAEAEGRALYETLREREHDALLRDLEDRTDAALDARDAWRAGRYLARLESLGAEPERVAPLRARLESLAAEDGAGRVEPEPAIPAPEADEIAVAAALLVEHDALVAARATDSPEGRLARAAALYHGGRRDEALGILAELAGGEGLVAQTARAWLADPEIHPEGELDRLWHQVRIERQLGRVGGERLAQDGSDVSRAGYRAWSESVAPLNLALGVPARVISGWQPEALAFREAAARYLERFPEGEVADQTRARLEILGPLEADREIWRDGRLVLPPARTEWPRSAEPYLIASDAALSSAAAELIDDLLLARGALLLSVTRDPRIAGLRPQDGHALIAALAAGLEQGELRGLGPRAAQALASLDRMEAELRAGAVLTADPWTRKQGSAADVARVLLHGGELQTSGDVKLRREEEQVHLDRPILGASLDCPETVVCVDRVERIDSALYARVDDDGELRIGAKAGFQGAMLALEIGDSGPRSQLVIPLGYWIGVGRWFPVEARVEVGLDGIGFGPRLGALPDGRDVIR